MFIICVYRNASKNHDAIENLFIIFSQMNRKIHVTGFRSKFYCNQNVIVIL